MLTKNIKIAHEVLNYFKFKIPTKTTSEHLKLKLLQVCKLDSSNDKIKIILEFDSDFTLPDIENTITDIKNVIIVNKLVKIILYAVSKSVVLSNINHLNGIPIIDVSGDIVTNVKTKPSNIIVNKTLLVTEPVRSGMKIVHDSDILITNLVSNNAEVVSGGNIYVYDDAKGRLIAGSSGDKASRIFVLRFNAELIAIGGVYRVIDAKLPDNILRKSVMIYLDSKEKLNIVPLRV